MAEEVQLAENRSFPPPPPFWKSFSKNNVERLEELQAHDAPSTTQAESDTKSTIPPHSLIPPELHNLVPPQPPASGKYRVFTEQHDIKAPSSSLEQQGIPQLYPTTPLPQQSIDTEWTVHRVYYLKKLIQSLMLNFLELLDVLSKDPGAKDAKLEDIAQLYKNAHRLVNDYRPHQARESVILMMEERLERGRQEVREVERMRAKIEEMLAGFQGLVGEGARDVAGVDVGRGEAGLEKQRERQRLAWLALEEEMVP